MTPGAASGRPNLPRPSVVTLACLFVAIAASLSLIELITALMNWGSIEMADQARLIVRELRVRGVDLSVSEFLTVKRWASLALIPFAVSLAVCAVFALRGDRRSRTATSILAIGAGLTSLTGGALGLIPAIMMFLAAAALWSPDARRWYRGERAVAAAFADPAVAEPAVHPSAPAPTVSAPTDPAPTAADAAPPPPPAPSAGNVVGRPRSVVAAGLVAIVGSLLAALLAIAFLVAKTYAHDAWFDAARSGPFGTMVTREELETAMSIVAGVFWVVLPVAAVGLIGGIALLARLRFGRAALFVWAWCMAGLGVLLLPLGLAATAGAVVVLVLLRRDDARDWTTGPI